MMFKIKNTAVVQTGASFTVALRRVHRKWRIRSWAWTKGTGGGIKD